MIEAWPLKGPLAIHVSRDPAPEPSAQVAAEWARLCQENPRHFDGPVLSVQTFDPELGEVLCRRDRYQRLAVQPAVRTGVQQLAVTGVLVAANAAGRRYVLLGKRSHETRIHGGQWELGPSGGVSPPPANIDLLDADMLMRHLGDEVAEEVGLELPHGRVVAYVRDHGAHSDDIAVLCDLGSFEEVSPKTSAANWEYTETLWLPLDTVAHFDSANTGEIIGATRALFRVLGWIDES